VNNLEMVREFQCPGCVVGIDPETCRNYRPVNSYGHHCAGHVLGTTMNFAITFALGLPKGFNRATPDFHDGPATRSHNRMEIRLWTRGTFPAWDKFNVAVWAMEQGGFLFVRTLSPRVARIYTDVIEGGTLAMAPGAVDVGEFYDEID